MHLNSYNLQKEHLKGSKELGNLLKLRVPQSTVLEGMLQGPLRHPPNPAGGLRGRGARGKAQPSPQTCGGEADLPSPPPLPAPAGSMRACGWARSSHGTLEHVGWGFLQAEVCLKGSAPHHASGVSSLRCRDGEVQEQSA